MTGPGVSIVVCGAVNWDITLFADHLPAPGEEVAVTDFARVPGGTGANVAVAAARLLGPGEVGFVGAVGDDEIGRGQRAILEQEGVVTHGLLAVPGVESGQAFITVDSRTGQNVIASALGANAALEPSRLDEPAVRSMLEGARFLAVTDPPLSVVRALLSRTAAGAAAGGARPEVFWDPGVAIAEDPRAVLELAPKAGVLVLNEVEARSLFGDAAAASPGELAVLLAGRDWPGAVVLKLGSRGAVVLDQGGRRTTRIPPLPLGPLGLTVQNTVGAGDAFLGALAAMRARGSDLLEAAVWASASAGVNVSRADTRGSPTWQDLQSAYHGWQDNGIDVRTTAAL